ncbi:TetR/AcrR family transcriptional regulator [Actinoplanes palleronii]|uniref:TetR family transcriptional regulator n=1 Tax=Actinoplanes palleronii TaxID=113570 RepID=A0ABQ4B5T7_9ACTN|nr:TetR family transcriptional regulator [Actinoplanes palleronii]GIE66037.1 TetR family transcriptional regulator [Actinoplanes palleronii]
MRRRPKDRRERIAQVAAELFCEHGYHGVSLEQIASTVGISGPAVYRHFPNKYALLVEATRGLLAAALSTTDLPPGAEPRTTLKALLLTLSRLAVKHRRSGGLYQWEWRYLEPEHRAEFRADLAVLFGRLVVPLRAARPEELTVPDAEALARAALSVFGSITTHRTPITKGRAEVALHRIAVAVLRDDPPTPVAPSPAGPGLERGAVRVSSRREIVLAEAIRLFHQNGYHAVGLDEIGRAAGITASSVYRYFPGKGELLAAALYRASERVAAATAAALADAADASQALHMMADSYVTLTFERSDLVSVYLAENNNLPEIDRHELRKVQRLHVEEWVRLLTTVRPGLPVPEARVHVHAALNLVTDLSGWVRFDRRTGMDRHLVRLMVAVLMA